jgi:hypothetical protein
MSVWQGDMFPTATESIPRRDRVHHKGDVAPGFIPTGTGPTPLGRVIHQPAPDRVVVDVLDRVVHGCVLIEVPIVRARTKKTQKL